MVVNWTQPTSNRGVILSYEVTYSPKGSLSQKQNFVTRSVNTTSLIIGGLSSNLAYDVRVRAFSVAGYGPYSSTESAQGRDVGEQT